MFEQEKCSRKKIFRMHLHLLELTDVILANGGIVQIPQFVADACQRILEHIETEGIFRKAGSSLRQKEIKVRFFALHSFVGFKMNRGSLVFTSFVLILF